VGRLILSYLPVLKRQKTKEAVPPLFLPGSITTDYPVIRSALSELFSGVAFSDGRITRPIVASSLIQVFDYSLPAKRRSSRQYYW